VLFKKSSCALSTHSYMDLVFISYLNVNTFPQKSTIIFLLALQPKVGQGHLVLEVSRSHTNTTVGRTPLEERSARRRELDLKKKKDTAITRDRHPCSERDFLFLFCSHSLLCPYFFVLIDLAFAFSSYCTMHTTKIAMPSWGIFLYPLELCSYFNRTCIFFLVVLRFAIDLSLLTTHNTNIHASTGFEHATPGSDGRRSSPLYRPDT
jgi:hypothetical protein